MMRFDERRLKQNDGDDFRDFVGEFLRASPGFGGPVPRDSGSVDGCIDLYCEKLGLVAECKFVGSDVKDETKRVDQEWEEVRGKLDHNLITLGGHATPKRAPFLPWADAEQPIKRYVFVTSARLANETKQRHLAERIQSFFCDNIGARPGYEHLRSVAVEVIDWTSIATRLVDYPTLVFKWLKQWPEGFAELDDRSLIGFRAFFHSDKLPYLSRDSWQPPDGLRHPWTETSLIEEIIQPEARDPILVLIGHGGVGKTRLGLECARRMRERGWWTIRCNGLLAKTSGLRRLLEESPTPKRVLLFVDYLETWPAFEGFANDVLELNQSSGHQIRVIATCRASYRDRLATFMKTQNIGGEARIEAAYSEAVTRHILSRIGATNIDALVKKCRSNFALAAFLAFLRHEKPDAFAVELSELTHEPSFEAWIVRRLQNAGLKDVSAAAAILAACEFETNSFDRLAEAHGGIANDLRRVLVADKWIERRETTQFNEDGPVWAAFHDIFADVVLAHALDVAPDRDDAIDRLLEQAIANDVFRQTFIALGRLKQFEVLASVDWCARLLELERRKSGALGNFARLLLASSLLAPEMRLTLIASNGILESAVSSDSACDLDLALTAAAISSAHTDGSPQSEFNRILVPLLDVAVARGRQANIILRLAFSARPERYRDAARAWMIAHPNSFQTHFLLKGWLDEASADIKAGKSGSATTHINEVSAVVSDWLAVFAASAHATFVLASWLDAAAGMKGDGAANSELSADMVKKVTDYVTNWLAQDDHATSDGARFIYASWLNVAASVKGELAADMVGTVTVHVANWLAQDDHAVSDAARFVYSSWLDTAASVKGELAADMVGTITVHVTNWLAQDGHAIRDYARFVYSSWLNAAAAIKGDVAADMVARITEHVVAWLAHGDHAISDEAQFVYTGWLNAASAIKGDVAADMVTRVTDHVTEWLAYGAAATSDEAVFIYKSWFYAAVAIKGDYADDMVTRITGHVVAWLSHGDRAISDDADFVYSSWLEAAAALKVARTADLVERITVHVVTWLAQGDHAIRERTGFIYVSWLYAAAEIRGDGAFDMVTRVADHIVAWLSHGDQGIGDQADFIYSSWFAAATAVKGARAAKMIARVEDHLAAWLAHGDHAIKEESGFIYKRWLEAVGHNDTLRFAKEILTWILSHQDSDDCGFVLESWLDKGFEFGPVAEVCFRIVRRLYCKPDATFILKHVVRQRDLPEDVVVRGLCWCARFPAHEDALMRLAPLVDRELESIMDARRLTSVIASVLVNQHTDALAAAPFKAAAARAILAALCEIGHVFPSAEKLARIYFVRWLRDGRLFLPADLSAVDGKARPTFDQQTALLEFLFTLMTYGEFLPATNDIDKAVLEQFCCWVGQWSPFHQKGIAELVEELSDRFGLPQLWETMLPKIPIELNNRAEELPNPFLNWD